MGKQSRRARASAPTDVDSAAAKRRVHNQRLFSEAELLEIFNSRAVTQFMTGTEEDQRKLVSPVLQERLHHCMPQVACPIDSIESLALKVGVMLNKMAMPRTVELLRGPTLEFVGELQSMFDHVRSGEEHRDADMNERQVLTKWLGKAHVGTFLRSGYDERRLQIRHIVRHEVATCMRTPLCNPTTAKEERRMLIVDFITDKILEMDMPDILAMFDETFPKQTAPFLECVKKWARPAHHHAQRVRTGMGEGSGGASEAEREAAMERIRAFRAKARKVGEDAADRVIARARAAVARFEEPRTHDWDAINERKMRAAARDRIDHAREVVRNDSSLACIAARSLDEALCLSRESDHSPENLQRYYTKFAESLRAQGYPAQHIQPLVDVLKRKFEAGADTGETVQHLMASIPDDVALQSAASSAEATPAPEPDPEPDPEVASQDTPSPSPSDSGGEEEPPPPPATEPETAPPPPPELPHGWKPIEWLNSKQYKKMLRAPGPAGDRLRHQMADMMDRATKRGATARDAATEAEMAATDAAACDREDARVQAKRDKKAKRRARKEKEEQAAKRVLAEQRRAHISRMVDELEKEEEEEAEEEEEEEEEERPGSSQQHAAAPPPFAPPPPPPPPLPEAAEVQDVQDAEFHSELERALQLSAEEATHLAVQAVLAEGVTSPAPSPEPEGERTIAECAVCLETATHLVSPCGHFCLCETCSKNMAKCPLCRGEVHAMIKVFVA